MDTSTTSWLVQREVLAAMDPSARIRVAIDLSESVREIQIEGFLSLIVRSLREADIPFMLTGSLAAAHYGAPRATQDLDLVVEAEPERIRRFADALRAAGVYIDTNTAIEALRTEGGPPRT
ncbi:MAG: hypothetical protein EA422_12145 [Gemmatimonadales bacterium]|nr:MAG: hypothetical protein EA422_12145 [Gemmatimonadales bacterium]